MVAVALINALIILVLLAFILSRRIGELTIGEWIIWSPIILVVFLIHFFGWLLPNCAKFIMGFAGFVFDPIRLWTLRRELWGTTAPTEEMLVLEFARVANALVATEANFEKPVFGHNRKFERKVWQLRTKICCMLVCDPSGTVKRLLVEEWQDLVPQFEFEKHI